MPELKMPQTSTTPQTAPGPAMDLGPPRDARYGGAFLRGPAESYKPGYRKTMKPLAGLFDGIGGALSGLTKRVQTKMAASKPVDDKILMDIFSGKGLIPKGVPGLSAGTTNDINDAMVLQALMAAMKGRRRRI